MGVGRVGVGGGGCGWEDSVGDGREGVGGVSEWGGMGRDECMCECVSFMFVNSISLYQSTAASTSREGLHQARQAHEAAPCTGVGKWVWVWHRSRVSEKVWSAL